ncbi:RagB/SusD family nutrient uptake outer membrane protein [Pedobacter nyackensis]|uniref:Starch-binding associating with outer membrane n=1 Tax=Pedobacter nyackensis TaxID=475255 RepID=A0A1W2A8B0_9SPHI|nr:RagB/SusD family nutrient uptake outer membrane protein [Pedobacter nyackensis]SMC56508.1 Starch-binding associating with outer membrane [Pedobacter nyackensis]
MKTFKLLIIAICVLLSTACKKYLDAVPNNKLTVPSSLGDYEKLLDNLEVMNQGVGPNLLEIGTDDYHIGFDEWQSANAKVRASYVWNKDIFEGSSGTDWISMYRAIYYANIVLEGLNALKVDPSQIQQYNRIKGSALFFRAFYFYLLEEVYGMPFNPETIAHELGIPLKMTTKLEEKLPRSTVKTVYQQIEKDLLEAKELLPLSLDFSIPNRPSRLVVYAFLSRMYLTMQNYQQAFDYSNTCLNTYGVLTDYNEKNLNSNVPFRVRIKEVMFDCSSSTYGPYPVDSIFYDAYQTADLRKMAYFRPLSGRLVFKGTYSRSGTSAFLGFATDELYLIRAECGSRLGNQQSAVDDLNTLLVKRYKIGEYIPYGVGAPDEVLKNVLLERRKELVFRGMRWIDLRRLNQDPQTKVTLSRELNGQTYTLEPNSPRYTYPIPPDELVNNPNIIQTER